MAKTDNIIINISGIWFGKKCAKISNIFLTRKQVISDPEAFLESGSETRMYSILLLWTPSLKYCSVITHTMVKNVLYFITYIYTHHKNEERGKRDDY